MLNAAFRAPAAALPFFFMGMLAQLPLILLGPRLRGRRRGNLVVWLSLVLGQPMLELLYVRAWIARRAQ